MHISPKLAPFAVLTTFKTGEKVRVHWMEEEGAQAQATNDRRVSSVKSAIVERNDGTAFVPLVPHGAGLDAPEILHAMGAELDALRATVESFRAVKQIRAWAADENAKAKAEALATIDRLRAMCPNGKA